MSLKYIQKAQKGRDTIVFVPGTMISPIVFDEIKIPSDMQAISISWMHSDPPWDIKSVGYRLAELIKSLELGRTMIAAYSSGGVIALIAALQIPHLIDGLMLSNTGSSVKNQGDPNLPQRIKEQWGDEFNRNFIKRCFAGEVPREYRQRLEEYAKATRQEAMIEAAISLRQIDLTDRLQEIKCPTMIVHGVLDNVRTIEHAQILKKGISNSALREVNAGHTVMLESPVEYSKALNELIAMIKKEQR